MNHKNLDIIPSLYDYYKEVQILMMNDPRVGIQYTDLLQFIICHSHIMYWVSYEYYRNIS